MLQVEESENRSLSIKTEKGEFVAVLTFSALSSPEQRASIRRLIGAAPELLEALKEVPAWFEEWNVEIGAAEETLLNRVNGAIAKAEGK